MPYLIFSLLLFLSLSFAPGVRALGLTYEEGKTYGTLAVKGGIEISPAISESDARSLASLFSSTGVYIKVSNPSPSFVSSPAFPVLDSIAGGWYVSAPDGSILQELRAKTSKPVIIEVTPFNAGVIRDIKSRFPAVRIHTAGFMLWPREDVATAFRTVPPPVIEAVSVRMESDITGDLFPVIKLMYDTFFDGSGDIPGSSNVKINYPSGSSLSLSGINPKGGDGRKKTAYRFGVAASASVTSVQFQNRDGKAPYRYEIVGNYGELSSTDRTIAARYIRFLNLNPSVLWPMAIKENGDPYDNTFLKESNSKPVTGIIGSISGSTEGILINASSQNIQVDLPYSVSANAYSSYVGSFILSTSLLLSPHEVIVFGKNISTTSPPPSIPPPLPSIPPARPTPPAESTPPPRATPAPASPLPSASPVPFAITSFPPPEKTITPAAPRTKDAGIDKLKTYLKISVVKADPFLKLPLSLFAYIRQADTNLETAIAVFLHQVIPTPFSNP